MWGQERRWIHETSGAAVLVGTHTLRWAQGEIQHYCLTFSVNVQINIDHMDCSFHFRIIRTICCRVFQHELSTSNNTHGLGVWCHASFFFMDDNKQKYMWAGGCSFSSSTLIFPAMETDSCFHKFRAGECDYSSLYCLIIYYMWSRHRELFLVNQNLMRN